MGWKRFIKLASRMRALTREGPISRDCPPCGQRVAHQRRDDKEGKEDREE
jgi:hypothetical protein